MKLFKGIHACFALIFVLLLASCSSKDRTRFYHPAEFEASASICFVWSTDYYEIIPKLAGLISQKDQVSIFIDKAEKNLAAIHRTLEKHHARLENIRFVKMNKHTDNIWIRDFGPVYLVNGNGEKKLVQFDYFWSDPGFMEDFATQSGYELVQSSFNSSGGAREVNGKGTLILCEAHEIEVNPQRSRQEIENEMIRMLGQKKIIWLKKGIPQDDIFHSGPIYDQIYPKGVHGHVDEFCRFVDANTLLISSVSAKEANKHPILAEAKKRLDENFKILENATDQDGNKFKVIKVPFAPLITHDRTAGPEGQIVASVTSYMNFINSNSLIILPSYVSGNSRDSSLLASEKEVENIFRQVFPSKEIIKVRADTINYYSGGFHCISIQEPYVGN